MLLQAGTGLRALGANVARQLGVDAGPPSGAGAATGAAATPEPAESGAPRSIPGVRPSTRSPAAAPTTGANLKPWPEKPAHTTVRSPRRSTIGVSLGVIA